jgi:hypothetical protein
LAVKQYKNLDACALCGKVYRRGPVALSKHIQTVHGVYEQRAVYQHMRQVPNPDYKGPE